MNSVRSDIAAHRGVLLGKVVVGALSSGRSRILTEATVRLIELHPGIQICTDESPYEALHDGLRSGKVDFLFGALGTDSPFDAVIEEPLFTEEMVAIVARNHPLATRRELSLRDLRCARWVAPRRGTPSRTVLEKSFSLGGFPCPTISVETGDMDVVRGILLQSEMIAAVSEGQLARDIPGEDVVVLPVAFCGTDQPIGLTWRRGARFSPVAEALVNEMRTIASAEPFRRCA